MRENSSQPRCDDAHDIERSLTTGQHTELKKLVELRLHATPVVYKKISVPVEIGPQGIATAKNQVMVLAILPDVHGCTEIQLLISKLNAAAGTSLAAVVVLNAGDHLIIYEYTQVVGNPGSWGLSTIIGTVPDRGVVGTS